MPGPQPRLPLALAVAGVVIAALAGCAAPPTATPASAAPAAALTGTLTVSAAASLKASFDEIVADFEAANPGVDVQPVAYDGSSTLATQIVAGAAVDVFASADERTMQTVVDAGLAVGPRLFASNTLVIATPADNPAGVTSLTDLGRPGTTVVLCAVEVPCGAASARLLQAAGVAVTPASSEQNVSAVLTKVASGDADAGLVYATDLAGRTDVAGVVPSGADQVVNRYPIVALDGAADRRAADAFVSYVTGAHGRAVLAAHGFGAP